MYHDVSYLLSRLINGPLSLRQIYFASSNGPVPDLAYQVDFPRLEIVLEGEFIDTGAGAALVPGDVLYVPAGGWNFPQWQAPPRPLACYLANSNSASASCNGMANNIKIWRSNTSPDAAHALVLFCYKRSMKCKCSRRSSKRPDLSSPACLATAAICSAAKYRPPHAAALFEAIRDYIDERYASALTRESVAQAFYISPNYLSHLFQKRGPLVLTNT